MPALPMLPGESPVARPARRDHPPPRQGNDDEESSDDERSSDDEDGGDGDDGDDGGDGTQVARREEAGEAPEENRGAIEAESSGESSGPAPPNDQDGAAVETGESGDNAGEGRAPPSSSSSESSSSSDEDESENAQPATPNRALVATSTSGPKSQSDVRRSPRRSPQTPSGKGKRPAPGGGGSAGSKHF
jgi:hypothetical protein